MGATKRPSGDLVIPILSLLVFLQFTVLLTSRGGPASASPSVEEGHDFGDVELLDGDSVVTRLGRGEPTLVLVFHSNCAHCEAVAPSWRDWLETAPPELAVLAVSREPHADGLAYAARHGWNVAVRSAVVPVIGGRARALLRLTPWVYALDEDGRVVVAGHGSELDRIAKRLLERSTS